MKSTITVNAFSKEDNFIIILITVTLHPIFPGCHFLGEMTSLSGSHMLCSVPSFCPSLSDTEGIFGLLSLAQNIFGVKGY
jgi:hypothetical protein